MYPKHLYISLATFLFGALTMVVPSGYSLGPALLLLGSSVLLIKRPTLSLERSDWLLIAALLGYSLVVILGALWHGQAMRTLDKPLRFWLAIPVLLLIMAYPPRLAWLWSGLAVGAVATGGLALWQKVILGASRADGHTQVIQFGNISLLLGMFCLAGLGWAWAQKSRYIWLGVLTFGAMGGLLASLLSGSRGGWIGFPLMLAVLYRAYGRQLKTRWKLTAIAVVIGGGIVLYNVPQTGVQHRFQEAVHDIQLYVSGETVETSVGFRFEMWKGATRLIQEKPFFGWGESQYQPAMQEIAERGLIHPATTGFDHAHNQFLDTMAKQGVFGLAALLALYLIPLRLFSRYLDAQSLEQRALAAAGAMLSVAYIDFSLTQGFLTHNSGVMLYAFWMVILWGCLRHYHRCRLGPA